MLALLSASTGGTALLPAEAQGAVSLTDAGVYGAARYVSSSQFSGGTEGAVTEDDPGNDTASGALSITDPDDGDNPAIEAQDFAGTYGALAVLDGGAWTYTLDNEDPDTNALNGGETVTVTFTVTGADDETSSA